MITLVHKSSSLPKVLVRGRKEGRKEGDTAIDENPKPPHPR